MAGQPDIRSHRLGREEIEACFRRCDGDVEKMAEALEVSQRGLLLKMNELGLPSEVLPTIESPSTR